MEKNKTSYIIISPVRNEANNIEKTIQSVLSQTIKPVKWVIVDDGSSDKTVEIVEKYKDYSNIISLIKLSDRGYYDLMSGGEIKAFYHGFDSVKNIEYCFLGKLDGDVSFNKTYYEELFEKFHLNPKLGIVGGGCYYLDEGKLTFEYAHHNHVRGAARIYRKACWDDIGGVIDNLGWDAIDVYKARMLGWETYTFNEIKFIHHVKTWTKGGIIHGRMRSGRMEYLMGSHILFFCFKAVRELTRNPYILCFFAFILGYLRSVLKREKRVVDDDLKHYIRKEQLNRLLPFK